MYREQCSKWAGLSTQTAISTESAHQNDLTRCAVYTQYVILRRPRCVPFSTWTYGYREHFTVLVIWTLVYREHVPRTLCRGCVPRTYIYHLCQSPKVINPSVMRTTDVVSCNSYNKRLSINGPVLLIIVHKQLVRICLGVSGPLIKATCNW